MMSSNAIPMTKQQKIDLYLRMADAKDKTIAADIDVADVEGALAEAGRIYRTGTGRKTSRTRVAYLAVAAIVFLAVLMTACVWSGLAGKALRGLENLFSQKNKPNMMNVAAPKQKAKKPSPAIVTEKVVTKIVFTTGGNVLNGGRSVSINIINSDGTGLRQLTEAGEIWSPTISPNGTEIVYTSNKSIWLINSDGTGNRRIQAAEAGNPIWSPDGSKISFSRGVGPDFTPCIFDLATGKTSELSPAGTVPGLAESTWLPSGDGVCYRQVLMTEQNTGPRRSKIIVFKLVGTEKYDLFSSDDFSYDRLFFSRAGNKFLVAKNSSGETGYFIGDYFGNPINEIQIAGPSSNLEWLNADNLLLIVTWLPSEKDEEYRVTYEVLDTDTSDRWGLFETDRNARSIIPHPSGHSGTPIFRNLHGDLYRVEMNGTMTKLTDTGNIGEIDYR